MYHWCLELWHAYLKPVWQQRQHVLLVSWTLTWASQISLTTAAACTTGVLNFYECISNQFDNNSSMYYWCLELLHVYLKPAWQQWQHVSPIMAAPISASRSAVCGQHQHLPPPHHGTPLWTPSLPPGPLCTGLCCSSAHRFQVLGQIWKGQRKCKCWWCDNSDIDNNNDNN